VADLDVNDFHDMIGDAQTEAERRVARLLETLTGSPDAGSAPAAAVDSFLVAVLRTTPAAEIIRRGGSAPAFARLEAEIARDWTQEQTLGGAR